MLCRSSSTIYEKVLEGGVSSVAAPLGAVVSSYSAKPNSTRTMKYLGEMLAKSQRNANDFDPLR